MKKNKCYIFIVRSITSYCIVTSFQLNSPQERSHACVGLANLVLESKSVQPLMENEIVRRVAPLILDGDTEIQESAAGVLRYHNKGFSKKFYHFHD